MPSYDNTALWQKALSAQVGDSNASERDRLRNAYEKMRERARPVAETIRRDLPDFTIHDITHLDALWEYADLVSGPDCVLTPCEAFVLGGAFLIHDLGMGLAAYPDGLAEIKGLPIWQDTVARVLRKQGREEVTSADISNPNEEALRDATAEVLRLLHAQRAESLALLSWKDDDGEHFHIIEDPELRASFGPLIGRIAHSHWLSADQLLREFPAVIGAPGGFPGEWLVDPLKLACIIRSADFSHLDDRRAPPFVRAIQRPSKSSDVHWKFQSRLYQPRLEGDRLVYTAKSTFSAGEAAAWWMCYDTLNGLDSELRRVDSVLSDTKKQRLAARAVAHSEAPSRMAEIIRTDGWFPVDTRIRVSAVANLVAMLGGEQLYGDTVTPPLRELMQNGADAIRARRIVESRDKKWGTLTVKYGEDNSGKWVEVEDSGVGMTQSVLTGCLLDFGTSLWGSQMMHTEFPGLDSKGFRSVGRYGIGFFSVFMWGEKVKVVTQRYDAAKSETLVLEFENGLSERPLMRKAVAGEYIQDAGTRVRVWLRDDSKMLSLLRGTSSEVPRTLAETCSRVAPCVDVNVIAVESDGTRTAVVHGSDWLSIDENELCKRLPQFMSWRRNRQAALQKGQWRPQLTLIEDADGRVYGRAAIWPTTEVNDQGCRGAVVVGGFYATTLGGIVGVLVGRPHTAARNIGMPTVPGDVLKAWAVAEREKRLSEKHRPEVLAEVAEVLCSLGVDISGLPFAQCKNGWVTGKEVEEKASKYNEIYVVQDAAYRLSGSDDGLFEMNENVFVISKGRKPILGVDVMQYGRWMEWPDDVNSDEWGEHRFYARSIEGALIRAIANGWGVALGDVLRESRFSSDSKDYSAVIGVRGGKVPVSMGHLSIICRP